jgi:hypothetical protein
MNEVAIGLAVRRRHLEILLDDLSGIGNRWQHQRKRRADAGLVELAPGQALAAKVLLYILIGKFVTHEGIYLGWLVLKEKKWGSSFDTIGFYSNRD